MISGTLNYSFPTSLCGFLQSENFIIAIIASKKLFGGLFIYISTLQSENCFGTTRVKQHIVACHRSICRKINLMLVSILKYSYGGVRSVWILHYGAYHSVWIHMIFDYEFILKYTSPSSIPYVKITYDSHIYVDGCGDIDFQFLKLKNVFHIMIFRTNV
ncbi:unnamed protein product [Vicia faba]|uniref:Uncharacterized protein n=1 Tax=Vicia faba TaxID=3906 RepID=A0AAV1AX87_VICFA|nr:unnamed protein product [Vicia faba]